MTQITDEQFISDPNHWPRWPLLPLISKDGKQTPGLLFADNTPTVFVGVYLWQLKAGNLSDQLKDCERKTYPNFQHLLGEWRID